jgi:hypothetical protein
VLIYCKNTTTIQTKAPRTPFRVTGRSFEQPSPEVCSRLPYVLACTAGMALMGYSQKLLMMGSERPCTRTN